MRAASHGLRNSWANNALMFYVVRGIGWVTIISLAHDEADDPEALTRRYHYYDPIYTLDDEGQQWWRAKIAAGVNELLSELQLEQGITVDA